MSGPEVSQCAYLSWAGPVRPYGPIGPPKPGTVAAAKFWDLKASEYSELPSSSTGPRFLRRDQRDAESRDTQGEVKPSPDSGLAAD